MLSVYGNSYINKYYAVTCENAAAVSENRAVNLLCNSFFFFFVHDLENNVHSLSLTIYNLMIIAEVSFTIILSRWSTLMQNEGKTMSQFQSENPYCQVKIYYNDLSTQMCQ